MAVCVTPSSRALEVYSNAAARNMMLATSTWARVQNNAEGHCIYVSSFSDAFVCKYHNPPATVDAVSSGGLQHVVSIDKILRVAA